MLRVTTIPRKSAAVGTGIRDGLRAGARRVISSGPFHASRRSTAAGWGAVLFFVAGLLAFANLLLPTGVASGDRGTGALLGLIDLLLGVTLWRLPWHRWRRAATLMVVPVALLLIGMFESAEMLTPYSYSSMFFVVAVWVGVSHPPLTAIWLSPLLLAGYVIPILDEPIIGLQSTTVVVPVGILVSEVISRAVAALERAQGELAELVTRDPLTNIHNRRYVDQALDELLARRERLPMQSRPALAAVIFDLDLFGAVNKQFGHHTGDLVLQNFAGLLRRHARAGDLVARIGGEEFLAILCPVGDDGGGPFAERVRADFASTQSRTVSGPITVTVSAGCSSLRPDITTKESLLRTADAALAMAKRAGRNQVVVA